MENKYWLIGIIALLCLLAGVQSTASRNTKTFDSLGGVRYTATFSEDTTELELVAKNPEEKPSPSGYSVYVDGWSYTGGRFNLSPGESWHRTFNISDGLDVEQDHHTVNVSTYGGDAKFAFDQEYSSLHPGDVAVPEITDIHVGTGMSRGHRSNIVYVTVKNPSHHTYAAYVVAYTQDTKASTEIANANPGHSETVTLELDEPIGSEVYGEIRLFMDDPNQTEGALAQVEFHGSADSETKYEYEAYEPFTLSGPDGGYAYHNPRAPGSGPLGYTTGVQFKWITAGALGALLLFGFVWWRR